MESRDDYNEILNAFAAECQEEGSLNLFGNIEINDLRQLNHLLDRFLVFMDELDYYLNDDNEIEDCQCGAEMMELKELVSNLYFRDDDRKHPKKNKK